MKASILSHYKVPDGAEEEIHRFMYILEDGMTVPHSETVSLRTARVLVAMLEDGNAFVRMLREIVRTETVDYDTLIGRSFVDRFEPVDAEGKLHEREE
jgi:hypothetical protein